MTTAPKKPASPSKGEPAKKKPAAGGAKTPSAFSKPLTPSPELAAIVGSEPLARTEVVSKVWDYIRKHKLQNPENKREIIADPKLAAVFGQPKATMFEMNKFLAKHLK
jgi:chromatin remodeling complex protein RSC6